METKITRRSKILEINNDMCHNYYYLVHGRFINDERTAYRKFKFVLWFDIFDLEEHFNYDDEFDIYLDNPITKDMITEYVDELAWSATSFVTDFNNEKQIDDFREWCHDSIRHYNDIAKYW